MRYIQPLIFFKISFPSPKLFHNPKKKFTSCKRYEWFWARLFELQLPGSAILSSNFWSLQALASSHGSGCHWEGLAPAILHGIAQRSHGNFRVAGRGSEEHVMTRAFLCFSWFFGTLKGWFLGPNMDPRCFWLELFKFVLDFSKVWGSAAPLTTEQAETMRRLTISILAHRPCDMTEFEGTLVHPCWICSRISGHLSW